MDRELIINDVRIVTNKLSNILHSDKYSKLVNYSKSLHLLNNDEFKLSLNMWVNYVYMYVLSGIKDINVLSHIAATNEEGYEWINNFIRITQKVEQI